MADRVRKPEWLKINIGANERYTQKKTACTRYAAVGVALIWGNVGEKEQPPS